MALFGPFWHDLAPCFGARAGWLSWLIVAGGWLIVSSQTPQMTKSEFRRTEIRKLNKTQELPADHRRATTAKFPGQGTGTLLNVTKRDQTRPKFHFLEFLGLPDEPARLSRGTTKAASAFALPVDRVPPSGLWNGRVRRLTSAATYVKERWMHLHAPEIRFMAQKRGRNSAEIRPLFSPPSCRI